MLLASAFGSADNTYLEDLTLFRIPQKPQSIIVYKSPLLFR